MESIVHAIAKYEIDGDVDLRDAVEVRDLQRCHVLLVGVRRRRRSGRASRRLEAGQAAAARAVGGRQHAGPRVEQVPEHVHAAEELLAARVRAAFARRPRVLARQHVDTRVVVVREQRARLQLGAGAERELRPPLRVYE